MSTLWRCTGLLLWLLQGDHETACSEVQMGCVPVFIHLVAGFGIFFYRGSGKKGTVDVT